MSAELYQFKLRDDKCVEETLRQAIEIGFDEVVVVGIKGTEVHTSKSANTSTVVWLGFLDYLKTFMYNRMAGIE